LKGESALRRGYVIRLGGDMQIAAALAEGVAEGTRRAPLQADQMALVQEEIRRQRTAEDIKNVAVHRGRTPEDWALLIAKAQADHGQVAPGALRRGVRRLQAGWALIVWAVVQAYRAQDRILGIRD